MAFAKVGGWDHHVSEGGVRRRVVGNLKQFSDALAAFYRDMGDPIERVVVLTMTEFGCTAREDRNRGTDHGHGHAMFVMGGPVRGVVYREWLVSGSSSFTKVAT